MNLFPSFGFLPKEGRPSLPSASFGKLHLWRGGGFPKEANVLREASPLALPSESFTSGGGRASSRRKGTSFTSGGGRASSRRKGRSFTSGGGSGLSERSSLPSESEGRASFASFGKRASFASFGKRACFAYFGKRASFASFGKRASFASFGKRATVASFGKRASSEGSASYEHLTESASSEILPFLREGRPPELLSERASSPPEVKLPEGSRQR